VVLSSVRLLVLLLFESRVALTNMENKPILHLPLVLMHFPYFCTDPLRVVSWSVYFVLLSIVSLRPCLLF
jgi:hypothetical protein